MQCQRCHFENMPGEPRCFKCGSVLEAPVGALDVHPPRMASWKRPWRGLSRRLRRHSPVDAVESKLPTQWASDNADIIWGISLSVVPGFAHLLKGGVRRILWPWLLWLVFLALNAFLFRTAWGWRALGVAAALHAWIVFDFALRGHLKEGLERVFAVLSIFAALMLAYVCLALFCVPGMAFIRTPMSIPDANVISGDTLLLRTLLDDSPPLTRGTLVAFQARAIGRSGTRTTIGQIVGLPDELLVIDQHVYTVNGRTLSADEYPVPAWFPRQRIEVRVRPHHYFVSSAYRARGARGVGSDAVKTLCLVNKEAIESRATMLWWPLNRRHRLNAPD